MLSQEDSVTVKEQPFPLNNFIRKSLSVKPMN